MHGSNLFKNVSWGVFAALVSFAPFSAGQSLQNSEGFPKLYCWIYSNGDIDMSLDLPASPKWAEQAKSRLESDFNQNVELYNGPGNECDEDWTCFSLYGKRLLRKEAFMARGDLPLGKLANTLTASGYRGLELILYFPKVPYVEVALPEHETTRETDCISVRAACPLWKIPETLHIETGYRWHEIAGRWGIMAVIFLTPLCYMAWKFRAAGAWKESPPKAALFSVHLTGNKALLLSLALFPPAYVFLEIPNTLDFALFLSNDERIYALFNVLIIAMMLTCIFLFSRYGEKRITLNLLVPRLSRLRKIWALLCFAGAIPISFGFVAAASVLIKPGSFLWGASCVFLASANYLFCVYLMRRALQCRIVRINNGRLFDILNEATNRAGMGSVRCYAASVSGRKESFTNATALSGKKVLVSEDLADRFAANQTEAILMHELGHLFYGHPGKRRILNYLAFGITAAIIVNITALPPHYWARVLFLSSILPAIYLLVMAYYRRQEFAADRFALRGCRAKEDLLEGLAAIHAINAQPLQWGRGESLLLTHPSLSRRFAALAAAAGTEVPSPETVLASANGLPCDTE